MIILEYYDIIALSKNSTKLLRGVMILRIEDVANVLNFLEQYSLTCSVREVKLTRMMKKSSEGPMNKFVSKSH
ncbi:hypothetical protein [Ferroplasma sp. Type II]|uniref:hypothetical protein n=1 Tax=Ferroplasma sp. Type II TaxID=261388 RepID=UPI0025C41832|nr:hypothetical protein [Ferroplasma sp. Type II]